MSHLLDGFGEVVTRLIEFVGLDFVDDDAGDVHSVMLAVRFDFCSWNWW